MFGARIRHFRQSTAIVLFCPLQPLLRVFVQALFMLTDLPNIIFSFSFFSIAGWGLEVSYRSIRDRRFVNPGLLMGPYLILYGTAALTLSLCIFIIHDYNLLLKALFYCIVTTGLEFISGFNAQYFFNKKLWDYSDQRFQYKGHICLKFSIYWTILSLAFEYILLPPYLRLTDMLSIETKGLFGGIILLIIMIDFFIFSLKKNVVKKEQIR